MIGRVVLLSSDAIQASVDDSVARKNASESTYIAVYSLFVEIQAASSA